ncbi:prenyltransferase [Chloroflexi bacterium CFX6]|nr:prenyltransferase [Chloroflexi bacterium CFX6]
MKSWFTIPFHVRKFHFSQIGCIILHNLSDYRITNLTQGESTMPINFSMWRKASWQLIKMDDKKEWDALDVVSKWLIATRSAVTLVTVYSCVIAGILAARDGTFDWLTFIIVTLGLFIAHGTNNILNDYTDFNRGVDKDNYFRAQYGVHPLVQNFWDTKTSIRWFIVSGALAVLAGVYALFRTDFSPVTFILFGFGALVLLAYTYPFKYWGLGEFMIFLIWGPIMIAGVYFVLTGVWNWNVVIAGVPFGLSVASINVAKHIDKREDDQAKGVGTFPVRVGEAAARRVNQAAIVLIYLVIAYLVFVPRYFTPAMLVVLLAYKEALTALKVMNRPKPAQPPEGWPAWPVWFSGFTFQHNRRFGGLLILGLIADALLRHFLPAFW